MPTSIAAFYRFFEIPDSSLAGLCEAARQRARDAGLRGLLILASEGCNATMSGREAALKEFLAWLADAAGTAPFEVKWSSGPQHPFRRLSVQIRPEIVTLGEKTSIAGAAEGHLSPREWHEWLSSGKPCTLIDVRNWYEVDLGKFRSALDPRTEFFTDFAPFIEREALPKDTPVLMYCTGGIRCEKAAQVMRARGFKEVWQLHGGILNYLKEFPEGHFEGECFVFDQRVAVKPDLSPSDRYGLCPHCGNPATEKISCRRCDEPVIVCRDCLTDDARASCSKNCAYHLRRAPACIQE